jgi:hypothetical protein
MICPKCGSSKTNKNGKKNGVQCYRCYACSKFFNEDSLPKETPKEILIPGIKGISEAELRSKYDNFFICQTMVGKLTKNNFLPERDFVVFCNFKQGTGYRQAMEDHRFDDYHGQAGGVTYWGHKDDVLRLKNEGVLR